MHFGLPGGGGLLAGEKTSRCFFARLDTRVGWAAFLAGEAAFLAGEAALGVVLVRAMVVNTHNTNKLLSTVF